MPNFMLISNQKAAFNFLWSEVFVLEIVIGKTCIQTIDGKIIDEHPVFAGRINLLGRESYTGICKRLAKNERIFRKSNACLDARNSVWISCSNNWILVRSNSSKSWPAKERARPDSKWRLYWQIWWATIGLLFSNIALLRYRRSIDWIKEALR